MSIMDMIYFDQLEKEKKAAAKKAKCKRKCECEDDEDKKYEEQPFNDGPDTSAGRGPW